MSDDILQKVQYLNELELTILSCLIAGQHCLFSTPLQTDYIIGEELLSTCCSTFAFHPAVLQCTAETTIDDLNDSLLLSGSSTPASLADEAHSVSSHHRRPGIPRYITNDDTRDTRSIARCVILLDLDLANDDVQTQVIELLRSRRIFTRSAMHTAPKDFLMIATLSYLDAKLSYHLNDMVAISQHLQADGLGGGSESALLISQSEIDHLRLQAAKVRLTAEVDAYLSNIVLFMRMSRYVQGGVSATATRHMRAFCRSLASLHGIDFVTPSLVMLTARKVYPHRIVLATATTEKSLQWGSDPTAVQLLLEDITVADVIDDVIASVDTPL